MKYSMRIRKATFFIQMSHPWVTIEEVQEIVDEIESDPDQDKMATQYIIELICDICEDI